MNVSEFDVKKVENAVREIAAANADQVYEAVTTECDFGERKVCYYVKGGGCLVGRAICKVYPELREELEKCDYDSPVDVKGMVSFLFPDKYDVLADKLEWLSTVQENQDSKIPWGLAVTKADSSSEEN